MENGSYYLGSRGSGFGIRVDPNQVYSGMVWGYGDPIWGVSLGLFRAVGRREGFGLTWVSEGMEGAGMLTQAPTISPKP